MNNLIKSLLFIFIIFLFLLPSFGAAQSYIQTHYLPDMSINDLREDTDGVIWIGTKRGLSNYNGNYYSHYTSNVKDSTSLDNDFVNRICFDKQQRIWVGTNEGINLFLPEKEFKQEISDLKYKPVYEVVNLDSSTLVVSTHNGISLFDKLLMKRTKEYVNPKVSRSTHIHYSKNKYLWVLSRYDKDIQIFSRSLNLIKSIPTPQKFKSLVEDDYNHIWARSNNGLFLINAETFNLELLPSYISNIT